MKGKLYQKIASAFSAYLNRKEALEKDQTAVATIIEEWMDKHQEEVERLTKRYMPSGSGVDNGTHFDFDKSKPERLVFDFSYHHMDPNGYYDGWTEHAAVVTPSLAFGMNLKIAGRDRNQIKDYLQEVFFHCLWKDLDAEGNEIREVISG